MKKFLLVLMTVVFGLSCCSCAEKTNFAQGDLLYDLGAESLEDIEKVEFWYKEYIGDYEEKIQITEIKDMEKLCQYTYYSEYPADKIHELYIFPNDYIFVTVDGMEYQLCLGEDGSLSVVPSNSNIRGIYKAKNGKGFTDSAWQKLIQKYE